MTEHDARTSTETDLSCVVALDLSTDGQLVAGIVDAAGTILARDEQSLGGATGEAAVAAVLDFAAHLLERAPHTVRTVAVGTPGIIDNTGTVRYATALQWRDVPLAERLTDRLGIPASVGNDIDMTTLAAVRFQGVGVRDLLLVSLDNSIGMGIMVGGRLVAGEHHNAGEIAHVTVFEDGSTCVCGRRGCILAYISAARAAVASQFVSDETKQESLTMAGKAIGVMIAPIASALNLTTVLISGPGNLVTPGLISAASDMCEIRTLPLLNTTIEFMALRDDPDLVLLGAAARALGDGLV